MAQYIDKDALVAKIEKRQSILDLDNPRGQGGYIELELVKDIINSRVVKEVDLEKEIDDWYNTIGIPVTTDALKETARRFFELGLKAQKDLIA